MDQKILLLDKDNVLLIYPKSKEQEIKGIVSQLKKQLDVSIKKAPNNFKLFGAF